MFMQSVSDLTVREGGRLRGDRASRRKCGAGMRGARGAPAGLEKCCRLFGGDSCGGLPFR